MHRLDHPAVDDRRYSPEPPAWIHGQFLRTLPELVYQWTGCELLLRWNLAADRRRRGHGHGEPDRGAVGDASLRRLYAPQRAYSWAEMVKRSCQLLASSYQQVTGLGGSEAPSKRIAGPQVGFGIAFRWPLEAGSWKLAFGSRWRLVAGSWQLVYNQRLQRLSVRRSCAAGGSPLRRIHLTANGSDAVLRRGNEPMRSPVFFESVA